MKSSYYKDILNKFTRFTKTSKSKFSNNFKDINFAKFKLNSFSNFNFKQVYSSLAFISFFSLNSSNVALCHNISDKEIDKIKFRLEEEIKSLEFKYEGKLKRQNVK